MGVTAFGSHGIDHRAPVALRLTICDRLIHAEEHDARPVVRLAATDCGKVGGSVKDVLLVWRLGHGVGSFVVGGAWPR